MAYTSPTPKLARYTVRTPTRDADALDRYCQERDETPSQVFRRGLRAVLPKEFYQDEPAAKRAAAPASKRTVTPKAKKARVK